MSKKILFLFFCVFALAVHSQNVVIKGSVTDVNQEPLLGVNIKVKGTTTGTITDIDGNFSINGPKGATLVVSYIGMVTQEVQYKGQPLKIVLKDDAQALEEVVVVGYGTMRKKDLTGSVVQVRPDKIANDNPKTVQDVLRGTPGLTVGYGEGDAGAKGGGAMTIRGQRSVYTDGGHNDPLLILDGMFFYGELSEINPDDIAQIDVLKDASAAAVYGARAANGVIIISTKKGKQGKPTINFTASIGLTQKAAYRDRWQNPEDYLQHYVDWKEKNTYGVNAETGEYAAYSRPGNEYTSKPGYFRNPNDLDGVSLEAWRAYTTNAEGESDLSIWARRLGFRANTALMDNLLAGKTMDWQDKAFRLGFNQDYNASISGAGEKIDYYMSLGYLRNEGAFVDDTYRSIRGNFKLNAKVTDWLELGANLNFQDRSDGEIGMNKGGFMENSPYAVFKDEEGNYVQDPLMFQYDRNNLTNWYYEKQYLELQKGYTIFNTIFNAKLKLPFGITYTFNAAPRFQYFHDRYFMSAERPNSKPTDRGVNREQAKRFDWSLEPTASLYHTANSLEPLHVQFDYLKNTVSVVNDYYRTFTGYKVTAQVYDIHSRKVFEAATTIDLPEDGVVNDVLTIRFPEDISQVHFIKLWLKDEKGKDVSSNFYWRSNDKYEGSKTLTGPASSGFETLNRLKAAQVKLSYKTRRANGRYFVDIDLKNASREIAFFQQLQLLDYRMSPIRPSFYSDNFFSLIPGERKTVTIETGEEKLGEETVLVLKGWNTDAKKYKLK